MHFFVKDEEANKQLNFIYNAVQQGASDSIIAHELNERGIKKPGVIHTPWIDTEIAQARKDFSLDKELRTTKIGAIYSDIALLLFGVSVLILIVYFVVTSSPFFETPSKDDGISPLRFKIGYTRDVVNIRREPSIESSVVGVAPPYKGVYILSYVNDTSKSASYTERWAKVPLSLRDNHVGYIYSPLLYGQPSRSTEQLFCSVIDATRREYMRIASKPDYFEKQNDQTKVVMKRAHEVMNIVKGGRASYWTGEIKSMSSGGGISIELPCGASLLSGASFSSMNLSVDQNSLLYNKLKQYHVGSKVTFSGFFALKSGLFHESSFTTKGEMREPEYVFKLSDIHNKNRLPNVKGKDPKFSWDTNQLSHGL